MGITLARFSVEMTGAGHWLKCTILIVLFNQPVLQGSAFTYLKGPSSLFSFLEFHFPTGTRLVSEYFRLILIPLRSTSRMVHRSHFNNQETEATEEELHEVAYTAISILSVVVIVLVLVTIYWIT